MDSVAEKPDVNCANHPLYTVISIGKMANFTVIILICVEILFEIASCFSLTIGCYLGDTHWEDIYLVRNTHVWREDTANCPACSSEVSTWGYNSCIIWNQYKTEFHENVYAWYSQRVYQVYDVNIGSVCFTLYCTEKSWNHNRSVSSLFACTVDDSRTEALGSEV